MATAAHAFQKAVHDGRLVMVMDQGALSGRGRAMLVARADCIDEQQTRFMALHACGIVFALVSLHAAFRLGLRSMRNGLPPATRPHFLVSVEAFDCPSTGISAPDRALTLRRAGASDATADSLVSPGHITPVLVSESSSALASVFEPCLEIVRKFAGVDVAAACDVMGADGEVASASECIAFASEHGLPTFDVRAQQYL